MKQKNREQAFARPRLVHMVGAFYELRVLFRLKSSSHHSLQSMTPTWWLKTVAWPDDQKIS